MQKFKLNQSVLWASTGGKKNTLKGGYIIAKVPKGFIPNVASLKKQGFKTDAIHNAEERGPRDHTSYLVCSDTGDKLYWPKVSRFW